MGDAIAVEEILAEPEEGPGLIQSVIIKASDVITSNGWYIIGLAALTYYVYQNYIKTNLSVGQRHERVQTPEEQEAILAKDEARRLAVQKLQDRYKKESDERAAKLKAIEEKKKQERLDEIARLEATRGERRLGSSDNNNSSGKKSFRPEYNPLMGDTSSSNRVCSRPSTGRQGG